MGIIEAVKCYFYHYFSGLVKIPIMEKVRNSSKGGEIIYVNQPQALFYIGLWKQPVENSVENVEKIQFSTAIFRF